MNTNDCFFIEFLIPNANPFAQNRVNDHFDSEHRYGFRYYKSMDSKTIVYLLMIEDDFHDRLELSVRNRTFDVQQSNLTVNVFDCKSIHMLMKWLFNPKRESIYQKLTAYMRVDNLNK